MADIKPKKAAQIQYELRMSRLAQGLCARCGEEPVSVNLDGTKSQSGIDCLTRYRNARSRTSSQEPSRVDDLEFKMHQSERRYYAELAAHKKRVAKVLSDADRKADENYKGLTLSETHRRVGTGTLEQTYAALMSLKIHELYLMYERYSLIQPQAKPVMQEKWGKPAEVKGYNFDMNAFPTRAVYGKPDGGRERQIKI